MTFRVGQRVVCVDARVSKLHQNLGAPWNLAPPLIEGAIYTIRGVEDRGGILGVYVYEAKSFLPPFFDGAERSFFHSRFRPLIENKTSISFTEDAPKDSERFDNRRKQKVRA